ncbi:MAG: hypothetical protein AAB433_06870 [Nitrospirota bacterium]
MENAACRLDIAFYRGEPDEHRYFQGLDFGPLLDGMVMTPRSFANVEEAGSIKLEIERTHEWELLASIAVAGSAVFLKGVLSELGKRVGAWLADQVAKLGTASQPEVRAGHNVARIVPTATSQTEVAVVLEEGMNSRVQVHVILQPRLLSDGRSA